MTDLMSSPIRAFLEKYEVRPLFFGKEQIGSDIVQADASGRITGLTFDSLNYSVDPHIGQNFVAAIAAERDLVRFETSESCFPKGAQFQSLVQALRCHPNLHHVTLRHIEDDISPIFALLEAPSALLDLEINHSYFELPHEMLTALHSNRSLVRMHCRSQYELTNEIEQTLKLGASPNLMELCPQATDSATDDLIRKNRSRTVQLDTILRDKHTPPDGKALLAIGERLPALCFMATHRLAQAQVVEPLQAALRAQAREGIVLPLLIQADHPTDLLLHGITFAGLLPLFATPDFWQGREKEAGPMLKTIRHALPEAWKARFDATDFTAVTTLSEASEATHTARVQASPKWGQRR